MDSQSSKRSVKINYSLGRGIQSQPSPSVDTTSVRADTDAVVAPPPQQPSRYSGVAKANFSVSISDNSKRPEERILTWKCCSKRTAATVKDICYWRNAVECPGCKKCFSVNQNSKVAPMAFSNPSRETPNHSEVNVQRSSSKGNVPPSSKVGVSSTINHHSPTEVSTYYKPTAQSSSHVDVRSTANPQSTNNGFNFCETQSSLKTSVSSSSLNVQISPIANYKPSQPTAEENSTYNPFNAKKISSSLNLHHPFSAQESFRVKERTKDSKKHNKKGKEKRITLSTTETPSSSRGQKHSSKNKENYTQPLRKISFALNTCNTETRSSQQTVSIDKNSIFVQSAIEASTPRINTHNFNINSSSSSLHEVTNNMMLNWNQVHTRALADLNSLIIIDKEKELKNRNKPEPSKSQMGQQPIEQSTKQAKMALVKDILFFLKQEVNLDMEEDLFSDV